MFDAWTVGTLRARNRFVRAATYDALATDDGLPTEQMRTLYRTVASGGAGLVTTGFAFVRPDGAGAPQSLGACSPAHERGLAQLAEDVHDAGAALSVQLVYGGSKSAFSPEAGAMPVLGPSALAHPRTGRVPKEATRADVDALVRAFADAAALCVRAGADAVELHAGHGYLVDQFLDERFNRRTDEYGGTIEGRVRFGVACVSAMNWATPDGFPVFVKMNCDDGEGMTPDEALFAARAFEAAGAAVIEVTGNWHAFDGIASPARPYFLETGARWARALDIPVVVTGGWRDATVCERRAAQAGIAAVGMARPLICEPDLIARWRRGDTAPSKCRSCSWCLGKRGVPCVLAGGGNETGEADGRGGSAGAAAADDVGSAR